METFESYAKKLRKIERETIQDIIAIKEENERLKRLYETDKESWKEQMYELQERIDKAIEYITSRSIKAGVELMPREKELVKILKGSDKE